MFFALAVLCGAASANAQADVMKACGAEWQKLKADGKVQAGQTWKSYLADCRKAKAATAEEDATPPEPTKAAPATAAKPAATTAAPAKPAAPTAAPAAGEKQLTPGQLAARERIKKCGAEWTAAKEAGKIKAGQKWPQYWSECNKRLKAAGQ
ncbi:MAG: hypothetical protein LWW93_04910 [Hyphomicrobiales bacterium]|nr:hypothetical protein [Hyphomicrobiales bacterium]